MIKILMTRSAALKFVQEAIRQDKYELAINLLDDLIKQEEENERKQ